jgi:hypothetical protein
MPNRRLCGAVAGRQYRRVQGFDKGRGPVGLPPIGQACYLPAWPDQGPREGSLVKSRSGLCSLRGAYGDERGRSRHLPCSRAPRAGHGEGPHSAGPRSNRGSPSSCSSLSMTPSNASSSPSAVAHASAVGHLRGERAHGERFAEGGIAGRRKPRGRMVHRGLLRIVAGTGSGRLLSPVSQRCRWARDRLGRAG